VTELTHVAQVEADSDGQGKATSDLESDKLEEIVVTAQKRIERLRDVPMAVTAINAEALIESNQLRLQDYYTRIPGLAFQARGFGEPSIAIRGVTSDYGANPTVGITIDDIPYGPSTGVGGGLAAPDFDPSDLARIEVLRGPQGTLYGASSLGGLLKYVTADPSPDRFSARIQGGFSSVEHGDDLGYNARGSINAPLGESFAIRASAFTREDPGYIDNVLTGKEDTNKTDASGGRLSALWQPSETTSLRLGALFQRSHLRGSNFADRLPGFGDLEHSRAPGTGGLERETHFFTANLATQFGAMNFVSLTGYGQDDYHSVADIGIALDSLRENTKFSQELRVSSSIGERFEWLAGAYYTHENTPAVSKLFLVDPVSAAYTEIFSLPFEMTLEEYAAFTDLTVKFTDRFDVQVGGRQSWITQEYVQGGLFGDSDATAFTYMLTPRLRLSPDVMLYARVASGYRAGGPNTNIIASGAPPQYDPDKTVNYELGLKGSFLGRKLTFEASVYHIDWSDLQLTISPPSGLGFFTNAGKATSDGVELSAEVRPTQGLRIAGWVSYNNAELAEDFPATLVALNLAGAKGDKVPDSVEWSAHLGVDQDFPLPFDAVGYVGGMVSYVGDRRGRYILGAAPRQLYPSYTQIDLNAGLRKESWTVNIFANNLTDKRSVLTIDAILTSRVVYTQPRTFGLSVSKTF
jgi:outer membrane receptor protein involved in Fe transport